jgi:DNA polymerase III delta prime subunit
MEINDKTYHHSIVRKLNQYIYNKKIPNIIFHGSSGCGKNTILSNFIHAIYQGSQPIIKNHVMMVNCAYGRGIRFIREELKYFAKTNVDLMNGERFKSIVLLNADNLTIDAQSALRRCIESFCHSTRFFIVVEDKNKLLKPILSRFCDIYVPDPDQRASKCASSSSRPTPIHANMNLHQNVLEEMLHFGALHRGRLIKLKTLLHKSGMRIGIGVANNHPTTVVCPKHTVDWYIHLMHLSETLYEKGFSALDLIKLVEQTVMDGSDDDRITTYELLMAFSGVKREFRNEKLLILFILYFMHFRSEIDLKNITVI